MGLTKQVKSLPDTALKELGRELHSLSRMDAPSTATLSKLMSALFKVAKHDKQPWIYQYNDVGMAIRNEIFTRYIK